MNTIRVRLFVSLALLFSAAGQTALASPPRTWMDLALLRMSVNEDINFDGNVDSEDLTLILAVYGNTSTGREDINQDGVVNAGDLAALFAAWSDEPIVRLRHMSGDLLRRTTTVNDVFFLDVSPFDSSWTRVWYRSSVTHRAVSVDIPVPMAESREVLRRRGWDPLS